MLLQRFTVVLFLFTCLTLLYPLTDCLAQAPPVNNRARELAVLRAIYEAFDGANWTGAGMPWPVNNPDAEETFHTWAGITTVPNTNAGRITRIVLNGRGLTGEFPANLNLKDLEELIELNLSNNRISGNAPTGLTELPKVEIINLSQNRLTALPDLTRVASLRTLIANNNKLDFGSIEPNRSIATFTITPQDSLGVPEIIELEEGDPFSFKFETAGSGVIYQWRRNGQLFGTAGAGANELNFTDISRFRDGGVYVLEITSRLVPNVTLFSHAVVVRVKPCFIVGNRIEVADTIYCEGRPAPRLEGSEVTGSKGNLEYQWQRSLNGSEWIDIGTNTKDFQPSILGATTFYRRIARDGRCEEEISNVLRIRFVPRIRGNRVDSSYVLCEGDAIRTFVSAGNLSGGDGQLRFLWQSSKDRRVWFDEDATETFTPSAVEDTTYFRRVVFDRLCFSDTSNTIRVIREPDFGPNFIGFDQTVCPGGRIGVLRDTLSGDALARRDTSEFFSFRWEISTDNRTWTRADSINRSDRFVNFAYEDTINRTTFFRRVVISPCRTFISNVVRVNIHPPIADNRIRTDRSLVCEGDTTQARLSGTIPTGGGGNYQFTWQSSLDGTNWNNRGTADTLAIGVSEVSDTTFFRRIVRSVCYADTSNVITINRAYSFGPNTIEGASFACVSDSTFLMRGSQPVGEGSFRVQWQNSPDAINWANIDTLGNRFNYNPRVLRAGNTYFRRLVDNGCKVDTSNFLLVRVSNPITGNRIEGTIEGNQVICEGQPVAPIRGGTITGGGGNYRYRWEVSDNESSGWALADTTVDFRPEGINKTTFIRRIVRANTCQPDTSNVVRIQVINRIENNIIRDNQEICFGATPDTIRGNLPTGGSGVYQYVWQRALSDSVWLTVGSRQDYFPVLSNTASFRRIVSSQCFSDTSNTVTVFVNQRISNNRLLGTGQLVCRGVQPDTIKATLPSDGVGVFRYQWQVSRDRLRWTNIPRAEDEFLVPPVPDTTSFYRRIVQNTCFSDTSLSIPIRISESPRVFAGRDTTINIGFGIRLLATGARRYVWTPREGLDNDSIASPFANPRVTTTYIVTGFDALGCAASDTVVVKVNADPQVEVVDVITPNGDGQNDYLYVKNIETYPENTLIVFNRWGQEVYRKRNYNNEWDGTINGRPLPTGIYFYVLQFEVTNRVKKGSFTVLE